MTAFQLTRTAAGALIVICAAVSVAAQKVSYDYDKTANFTTFKTFTFKDGTKSNNPLVDQRIVTAVTSVLNARGMTRSDGAPDVVVVTHLSFEKSKDISAWSTSPSYGPYGWGWGSGWGSTEVRVHDILTGTLVIDVIDIAKGTLAWRGIGEKEVNTNPKPSSVDKNVDKAVMKIFRNFPPGAASN